MDCAEGFIDEVERPRSTVENEPCYDQDIEFMRNDDNVAVDEMTVDQRERSAQLTKDNLSSVVTAISVSNTSNMESGRRQIPRLCRSSKGDSEKRIDNGKTLPKTMKQLKMIASKRRITRKAVFDPCVDNGKKKSPNTKSKGTIETVDNLAGSEAATADSNYSTLMRNDTTPLSDSNVVLSDTRDSSSRTTNGGNCNPEQGLEQDMEHDMEHDMVDEASVVCGADSSSILHLKIRISKEIMTREANTSDILNSWSVDEDGIISNQNLIDISDFNQSILDVIKKGNDSNTSTPSDGICPSNKNKQKSSDETEAATKRSK